MPGRREITREIRRKSGLHRGNVVAGLLEQKYAVLVQVEGPTDNGLAHRHGGAAAHRIPPFGNGDVHQCAELSGALDRVALSSSVLLPGSDSVTNFFLHLGSGAGL